MEKADYLEFIETRPVKFGAWCIWCHDPEKDYGYKIYFAAWGGPRNFLNMHQLSSRASRRKANGFELLSRENLDIMLEFHTEGFNAGIFGEPLEIFEHKSIYGIKHKYIDDVASDELWDNRTDSNLAEYSKLWDLSYANWLLKEKQRHNHGQADGKLVLRDIDWSLVVRSRCKFRNLPGEIL